MRVIYEPLPRLHVMSDEEQAQVDVGISWRATARGTLVAENVETNVLLAVHNSVTGAGVLGQFGDLTPPTGSAGTPGRGFLELKHALWEIRAPEFGPRENTTLWIGGAAASGEVSPDSRALLDRAYADTLLGPFGTQSEVITSWTPEPYNLAHARLNAETGVLTVEYAVFTLPGDPAAPPPA